MFVEARFYARSDFHNRPVHGGGGNVAVSFPIAFPNAAVAVVPNSVYNGGANNPSAHSKSASGFTCYWTGSATITIDYIAIGY